MVQAQNILIKQCFTHYGWNRHGRWTINIVDDRELNGDTVGDFGLKCD